MSELAIVYTDAFADAYRQIASENTRRRIRTGVNSIATFPDMGAAMPRESLVNRYGTNIRTLPAGVYVIVYEHVGQQLTLIALVPGKLIV